MTQTITSLVTDTNEAFEQIIRASRGDVSEVAAQFIAATNNLHHAIVKTEEPGMLYVMQANIKKVAEQVNQIAGTFGDDFVVKNLAPVVETWHLQH